MSNKEPSPREDEATTNELIDGMIAVMADAVRKRLLSELASADDRRTLERLATDIAISPSNGRTEREDATANERIAIALHHLHLPKLADHGLVEYDHRDREARVTDKGRRCASQFGRFLGG